MFRKYRPHAAVVFAEVLDDVGQREDKELRSPTILVADHWGARLLRMSDLAGRDIPIRHNTACRGVFRRLHRVASGRRLAQKSPQGSRERQSGSQWGEGPTIVLGGGLRWRLL